MRTLLLLLFLFGLPVLACAQEPEAEARHGAIEAFYPVLLQALADGNFDAARPLIDQAIAWEPEEPVHWYNLACLEARARRPAEALQALHQAVALGYADAAHMAQDADLASLHGYEPFQRLLAVATENAGQSLAIASPTLPAPRPGTDPLAVGVRVKTGCYGTLAEGTIEQGEGNRYYVRFPAGNSSCDGWREASQIEVLPPEPGRGGAYSPGAPVDALLNGSWQPAVILTADNGQYLVHYENYSSGMDAWVTPDDVRQTPERSGHRTGSQGAVPPGEYGCYGFSYGGGLQYQSSFTITGNGTYKDYEGTPGRFTKDETGIVRFQGGAFDGSQGDFQYNYGRAFIYLHVPDRPGERAGMDCEGPTP